MTYLDKLRERRTANKATEQKLRLFVRLAEAQAVLVVEGDEDSDLYANAFHQAIGPEACIRVIICKGKGGVLGLRDFADANFPHDGKILFFIDRDHDDLLGLSHGDRKTYITDYYSIEWDACTEDILCALVARHYTLSAGDPIWSAVRTKFTELMNAWLCYSKPVMQAIVFARRRGEDLDLDQLSLSDICRLDGGVFVRTPEDLEVLLKKVGSTVVPNSEELIHCDAELARYDIRLYVRGKLVVQFFCEFLRRLSEICGDPRKIDGRALETAVQIGKKNYFQFILGDWLMPDSLRNFFAEWQSRQGVAVPS